MPQTTIEEDAAAITSEDIEALRRIESLLHAEDGAALVGPHGTRVDLPPAAVRLLRDGVAMLRHGAGVTLVPVHRHLTTQEAADLLNVSRQYLTRILDEGTIPFQRVGNRRRLALVDVLAYKHKRDVARREALDELIRLDDEAGLYAREAEIFGQVHDRQ